MGIKVFVRNWVYWSEGIIALRTIRKNSSKYLKFLWSIIIILTFVAFCIHAAFLIVDYVHFDSRIYYLPEVTFPAVTVCSINPFKQNKINQSSQLSQFMDAYNFILEKRQSLLKTNQSTLRAFDDSNLDELIRQKRQTCPTSSKVNQYNSTFTYDIQSCNNVSVVKLYCANGSLGLQLNMSFQLDTKLTKIMDATFYYCQSVYLCGNGDPCTTFANTMSVLKNINGCLTDQGLVDQLQYPPDFFSNNPANNMARQVGINCNFANRYSTYAYFAKPSNKYNGTYSYISATQNGIGNISATIDNCDRSGTVVVQASIPANCTNNYINIISNVTQCMADYSCGDACVYGDCPFTKTPMEQCGNSAYYDLMCSIAVCNATSSTEYSTTTTELFTTSELTTTSELSTTTDFSTTHELSTKTSQELTTSSEATTIVVDETTTEPKTLSTSTELTSTENTPFDSSTTTMQSSTTTIFTTESTSTSPPITTTQTSSTYEFTSTSTNVETTSPTTLLSSTSASVTSTTQIITSETTSESSTSSKTTETTRNTSTTPTSTVMSSTIESSTAVTSSSSVLTSQISTAKTLITTPLTTLSSSSTFQSTTDKTTSFYSTTTPLSTLLTIPSTISTSTLPSSTTSTSIQTTTQTTPGRLTSDTTTNLPLTTSFTTDKPLTSLTTKKLASASEVPLTTSNSITTSSSTLPPTTVQTTLIPTTQTSSFSTTKTSDMSSSLMAFSTKMQFVETSVFPSSSLSSQVATTSGFIASSTFESVVNVPLTSSTILSSTQISMHQPTTLKDAKISTSTSTTPLSSSSVTISTSSSSTSSITALESSTEDFGAQQTTSSSQATNTRPANRSSLSSLITTQPFLTTKPPSSTYETSSVNQTSTTVVSSTTSHEMTLREIANLWGLSEYQNQPSFISHVRQALIEIAASLTPEERQELCYSLPELVSSCNIGKSPCDMDNDFSRVFDVDYGYCYTFNSNKIRDVYRSSQTGALHGLRMVLFTNPITYLNSTESKGFKVVLHDQDYNPFPNTEGYFGAVGESIRFIVEEDRYSRLNHPYNECDNLNSLKHRNQPFYYDGDYSIEGCLRSCFQQKMVNACKCADPRFPYPNDDSFCSQTNLTNYNCSQHYIETEGDYYFVDCDCANSCNQTEFSAQLWKTSWPNGAFFYEQYCPSAELNNSAEILVYYNRLRYSEYIERPQSTFVDLLSALGGATALWIGCCAIFIGELLLLFIQSILWCFCCKKELPEVPSCRHFDYDNDARNDRWLKEGTPLHFENHMNETTFNDDILFSEYHVMYKQIIPLHHVDHIPPAPVSSVPLSRVYID